MSREAVLLQWERKIEAAERLDGDSRRFVRSSEPRSEQSERATPAAAVETVAPEHEPAHLQVDEAEAPAPRRFERSQPVAERRTITITGQPTPAPPARRRRPVLDAQLAQPDRIALWAFLLGLLLVAVAAGTAHA